MYVYIRSRNHRALWMVGFYNPSGEWISESDHSTPNSAAERIHYLNGGKKSAGSDIDVKAK